ncbi:DUF397 domain-containing protein [Streptomyces sp. AC512_CC834]|uniref:DUF397 domain-containing protein n=1 Tax=Streptomyces sp. AC512_CC834 TaxID=2823691 RepID=UPI001C2723B6|nr:DUF397 domain-containing protein [Streptomyces sp. AC512_CC834]
MNPVDDASTLSVSWRKSTYSDSGAQCVECGLVDRQWMAVRDSKNPTGPALVFDSAVMSAFTAAVARGGLRSDA